MMMMLALGKTWLGVMMMHTIFDHEYPAVYRVIYATAFGRVTGDNKDKKGITFSTFEILHY